MAETATRRAQNNKKRRTCACMIHLQIWLAMPPAPRTDGPGCSTRQSPRGRFLRDGLPLSNLGYASAQVWHTLGLVRCPASNTNGILLLGSVGKPWHAARLTVSSGVKNPSPRHHGCDMIRAEQQDVRKREQGTQ